MSLSCTISEILLLISPQKIHGRYPNHAITGEDSNPETQYGLRVYKISVIPKIWKWVIALLWRSI